MSPGRALRPAALSPDPAAPDVPGGLLPAPLVDTDARDAFFAAVRRFDAAGQAIWQTFLSGVRMRVPMSRARPAPVLETAP